MKIFLTPGFHSPSSVQKAVELAEILGLDDVVVSCEGGLMRPTEPMVLSCRGLKGSALVATKEYSNDYTPHYAKKNKRGKFKRKGRK